MPQLDTSTWPDWAQQLYTSGQKIIFLAAGLILIWLISIAIKRTIRWVGRRNLQDGQDFEGSDWDIAASLSQFLALILLIPIPLGFMGFDMLGVIQHRGPGAIAAIVSLGTAVVVSGWLSRSIRNFGAKAHRHAGADDTLFAFAASILKYFVFAIAMVFALTQLGFPTASLAALIGAAGLAIALALQDTLKAVASGVMLALFRPFRLGDWVLLNGEEGEVTDITPFQTVLKQSDNKVVTVTNDKVWGEAIINFTRHTRRRLDLYFDVSYDDNLDHALGVLKSVAEDHGRVLAKSDIWVGVHALADWSVKLRLRAWVATPEFVDVRAALTKGVKEAFDAEGITIPYPHQVEIEYRGGAKQDVESVSENTE